MHRSSSTVTPLSVGIVKHMASKKCQEVSELMDSGAILILKHGELLVVQASNEHILAKSAG